MLLASNHAAKTFALVVLLLLSSASAEARCPFAGMTLPDPEVLQGERDKKVGGRIGSGVVRTGFQGFMIC